MREPYDDFADREFAQERLGKYRPSCSCCGEKIYSRTAMMRDGDYMCMECFHNVYSEVDMEDFN